MLHKAHYVRADEDPIGKRSLELESQDLATSVMGVPKSMMWVFMRPFFNNIGMRLLNFARYQSFRAHVPGEKHLWSHVEFSFLLDYVPDWRLAYGREGFIQYQPFIPKDAARETIATILGMCRKADLPPYLLVLKKHREDPFLLTHALDGYSLAMDMRVHPGRRQQLWDLCHRLSDVVNDAGGKFYPAKDAVLRTKDVRRSLGEERLEQFATLKKKLDPANILRSDLSRRWLGIS